MSEVFFRVRLDAAMERGEDRAAIMEQWNRPPEEWERFRPIELQARGLERLTLQTPNGPVEIVPSTFVPSGSIVVLNGRQQSHSEPRRGVGLGTIQESLDYFIRAGARDVRVLLAPSDYAELIIRTAEMRGYDATPFPRSLFGIDEQIWSPIAGARWPTAEEVAEGIAREINRPPERRAPIFVSPKQFEQYQRLAGATLTVTNVDVEGRTVTISADAPPAIPATSRRHRATPSRVPAGLQRKPWGR